MKLNKREKTLAIVFGSFIFLFLLQRLALLPFTEKLEILNTQIESTETKLERLLYIDSQKESIAATFSDMRSFIEIGKTEEDALSVIMKKIEEIAKECRIGLLNMKPDTTGEKIKETYSARKIEIDIEGGQREIAKFLYKIENSNYPLSVTKLDFKIKDRDKSLMEADMDVYFIYFL
ncbi:MAG: hypothetical protein ISS34_05100 [Candidatus Omnitrophica bacterium]|nr:hypothetical protein [Candidatus Omnitrophota bacterium]